jgi:hypothetical protein
LNRKLHRVVLHRLSAAVLALALLFPYLVGAAFASAPAESCSHKCCTKTKSCCKRSDPSAGPQWSAPNPCAPGCRQITAVAGTLLIAFAPKLGHGGSATTVAPLAIERETHPSNALLQFALFQRPPPAC